MADFKLSILIPIYNAAPYLRRCVESVCHFVWPDKEILLIDDGSTDGSIALCDALAAEYACREVGRTITFRVVRLPHGGVSVARNVGLRLAAGDWIWMVDADDYLEASSLDAASSGLLEHYSPTSTRWILTGFIWEEAGRVLRHTASPTDAPYNLWCCWFSRACIAQHRLHFTPGRRYAEDQEFILKYRCAVSLDATSSVAVIAAPLYHYTKRPGSAMTRPGMTRRQVSDIIAVTFSVSWVALLRGVLFRPWFVREVTRLLKTAWVVARSSSHSSR